MLKKCNLKYYGQKYASNDVQKQFLSSPLEVSDTHSCYNISSVYVHACIVHASIRICPGHTSTFVHELQNNLAKLFSQMSSSDIRNMCSGSLEVKVILEGQMIK